MNNLVEKCAENTLKIGVGLVVFVGTVIVVDKIKEKFHKEKSEEEAQPLSFLFAKFTTYIMRERYDVI